MEKAHKNVHNINFKGNIKMVGKDMEFCHGLQTMLSACTKEPLIKIVCLQDKENLLNKLVATRAISSKDLSMEEESINLDLKWYTTDITMKD